MLASLTILAEGAAEGTKEVINPVLPTIPETIWGAIAFFLLLVLMWAVCLPPIKKAMRQREEQIQGDLESAERAAVEAEQVRRDYDATLAEARSEAARIIEEARQAADAQRAEIVGAADTEVAAQRMSAMAEIETDRRSALDQLRGEVGGLAVAAASKVVQRQLDAGANQSVVDDHVNRISGQA